MKVNTCYNINYVTSRVNRGVMIINSVCLGVLVWCDRVNTVTLPAFLS